MNLGAHISISGGIYNIFERAEQATAHSLQIFVTNQNQWSTKRPADKDLELYFQKRDDFKPYCIVTHSRYLINLCSPNTITEQKSMAAIREELELCDLLDIPYLVLHPGSYKEKDEKWGLDKIVENLDKTFASLENLKTVILLENTAGQGTNLGYKFEQLKYLIDNSSYPEYLATCFDTCHAFTAGYDLINKYDEVFEEFDRIIGIDRLKVFHLNDSKREFASKKDRHAHIGKGELGIEPFQKLMNDSRFAKTPMVLETPKGDNDEMDAVNLKTLRSLREKL